jgi:hypothetical protein
MRATVVVEGEEMSCDCGADIILKLKKKKGDLFYDVMNLVGENLIPSITLLFSWPKCQQRYIHVNAN